MDITLNKGEIVGIAGLVGAGRTELARLIFGIDPIGGGKLFIKGKEIKDNSPVKIVKRKESAWFVKTVNVWVSH